MGNRFRYDAFISYRHCQPDSEIAQRLQNKLENFRLPKAITEKIGKKRPLRIFRDETELSVADDLSEAITTAIWESKYLICVCSPAYLESVWCMKEIEAFLRFNDRKHILLVLADGEPDTAFPEVLLYEEAFQMGPDGHPQKTRQYKEPLAADCRGDSPKERKAKTDNAVIRLVSGIIGISYEELSQRHRKEAYNRARNRVIAVFGVLLAIIAVCVFFIIRISNQKAQIKRQQDELQVQKDEIEAQRNTIQQKYADSLAATSEVLLRSGDRKASVYAARLGFSDDDTDNFSEPAMQALVEALGIYDLPGTFSCDDDIILPVFVNSFAVSPFGGYAVVHSLDYRAYLIDLRTGESILDYTSDYFLYAFDGDNGFVFKREGENIRYFDLLTGTETDLGIDQANLTYDQKGNGYALITPDHAYLYRGSELFCCFDPKNEISFVIDSCSMDVFFSVDGKEAFIETLDYGSLSTYFHKIDVKTGNRERILLPENSSYYGFYTDGNRMVWSLVEANENYLCLKDVHADKDSIAKKVESSFDSVYVNGEDLVACNDEKICLYDFDLNLLATYPRKIHVGRDVVKNDEILLFDDGGYHRISNGEYSYVLPEVSEAAESYVEDYCDGKLYLAYIGENHIYSYRNRDSQFISTYSGSYEELDFATFNSSPESDSFLSLVLQNNQDYSEDRVRDVVICQNADLGLVHLFDGTVYIYVRSSGQKVKTFYGMIGFINAFSYDNKSDCYYISGGNGVEIYDSEFRNIYRINNVYLAGYDLESQNPVLRKIMENYSDEIELFLFRPISRDEVLSLADEYLDGYEPDERIKEKYGLD